MLIQRLLNRPAGRIVCVLVFLFCSAAAPLAHAQPGALPVPVSYTSTSATPVPLSAPTTFSMAATLLMSLRPMSSSTVPRTSRYS
jgi:hypothetical protein